jgi:hypothetical protein
MRANHEAFRRAMLAALPDEHQALRRSVRKLLKFWYSL